MHLADKTKKDTGYNRKIINHILEKSSIVLKYNIEDKGYTTLVKYHIGTTQFTVDPMELGELFNKAKIIVNESQNKDEQLDEYQTCMVHFNSLGKELTDMMSSFKTLRELGLINYKFIDIVDFLNEQVTGTMYSTNPMDNEKHPNHYRELHMQFSSNDNGLQNLKKVNQALVALRENLTNELYSYYSQECYLFTYFYGKKLYFLIEYLRNRLDEEEADEC